MTYEVLDEGGVIVEVQTDKDETKDCPCTYPDCEVVCRVNKFYAPAKARCQEHDGKPTSAIREAVTGEVKKEAPKVAPNYKLRDLRCPFCEGPLEVLAIHDTTGTVTFGCPDDECMTVVEIRTNWRPLQVRNIPHGLEDLADALNERQLREVTAETLERIEKGQWMGSA